MDDQIFTRATMRTRGATALACGKAITEHGMNHDAAALHDWRLGYVRAAWLSVANQLIKLRVQRIDADQAGQ